MLPPEARHTLPKASHNPLCQNQDKIWQRGSLVKPQGGKGDNDERGYFSG